MSRWQRLGVVISILWLIAVPAYVSIENFLRPERYFQDCMSRRGWDVLAFDYCNTARSDARDHVGDELLFLVKGLTFRDNRLNFSEKAQVAGLLWLILLGPIALLWIVGGIVIGTTPWIMRGASG